MNPKSLPPKQMMPTTQHLGGRGIATNKKCEGVATLAFESLELLIWG